MAVPLGPPSSPRWSFSSERTSAFRAWWLPAPLHPAVARTLLRPSFSSAKMAVPLVPSEDGCPPGPVPLVPWSNLRWPSAIVRQYARLAMLAQLHLISLNCAIIDAQIACRTVLLPSRLFTPKMAAPAIPSCLLLRRWLSPLVPSPLVPLGPPWSAKAA